MFREEIVSAAKSLRAARGTSAAAIATLALGIGVATVVVAVAYGVLVRPLPLQSPDRLVVLSPATMADGSDPTLNLRDLDRWRSRLRALTPVSGYAREDVTVRGMGDPETVHAAIVDRDFFEMLGAPAMAGDAVGLGDASVAISARYAARLAAAPAAVLGRTLTIGAVPCAIRAVMPASFAFPTDDIDVWVPARMMDALIVFGNGDSRQYHVVARLAPGATLAEGGDDAERVRRELNPNQRAKATVRRVVDVMTGDAKPTIALFLAAAALLLMVACANVATLLVSRSLARGREFAVRLAIGASPMRLVRAALAESLVIALAGAGLGTLAATAALRVFVRAAGGSLPRASAVAIDLPVLLAMGVLALVVTLACGVVPAINAARTDFAPAFRETGVATRRGGRRVRAALVAAQVALAVVLLTSAGLLGRTVVSLLRTNTGIRPDHVIDARLLLSQGSSADAPARAAFVRALLARVRALPGVSAAGVGGGLPPRRGAVDMTIRMINERTGRDDMHAINLVPVTPGYLEALGVRLISGRWLDERDVDAGVPVAMMSETSARDLSWSRDVLDRDLSFQVPQANGKRVRPRVVGVVSDVRYKGLDAPAEGNLYILWSSLPMPTSYLTVRASGSTGDTIAAVTRVVRELDPALPVPESRSLDAELNLSIAGREMRVWLVASFAVLAFGVALVGLAAALVRSVTERRRELAIRAALGSTPRETRALVMRGAVVIVGAGAVAGVAAALAAGHWLARVLYGVSAYDARTYAVVVAAVAASSLAASYWPARRAARVDPLELMRQE